MLRCKPIVAIMDEIVEMFDMWLERLILGCHEDCICQLATWDDAMLGLHCLLTLAILFSMGDLIECIHHKGDRLV